MEQPLMQKSFFDLIYYNVCGYNVAHTAVWICVLIPKIAIMIGGL